LELKLLTKSAKIKQLNSLLDTLKRKYGQVRNEKDEALRTQKVIEKERDTALIERDTALLGLENFNQQLDDVQQELIRTQRENRKLTKKLNQQKEQQAKNQQQTQKQSNFLKYLQTCLASAGVGYLSSPTPQTTEKDLQELEEGTNKLIQQRDYYRQQVESHHCDPTNPEQPASKTQVKIIQQNNEQEIIRELNTTLKLNLNNPTLKQVISEIQSRIAKDPVVVQKGFNYAFDTVQEIEKELINQNTPFGEDLETIKELEIKGLNELFPNQLEESFINQIKQVQNYSQLVQVRNNFLAKHLAKVQSGEIKEVVKEMSQIEPVKQNNLERCIWISLLVVSLIGIGGLLMKLKKKSSCS
jgi:hypothetical protein